jgi:hypothetical protein
LYAELSARALANSRRPEFDPDQQIDRFVDVVERQLAPRAAGAGEPAADETARTARPAVGEAARSASGTA